MLYEHPSLERWKEIIREENISFLYAGSDCAVCIDDFTLAEKYGKDFPLGKISQGTDSLMMGQYLIFAFPTLVLFHKGVEVHRESRFIDFQRMEKKVEEWRQK